MVNDTIFTRRKAQAALVDAFNQAGLPADWLVLPFADDTELLLVVDDREVRWLGGPEGPRRAVVIFESPFEGVVVGDNIHAVVESRDFMGEDFGFERPFAFELPFDIGDHPEIEAWRQMPARKLPPRPRQPSTFKAKRAIGS